MSLAGAHVTCGTATAARAFRLAGGVVLPETSQKQHSDEQRGGGSGTCTTIRSDFVSLVAATYVLQSRVIQSTDGQLKTHVFRFACRSVVRPPARATHSPIRMCITPANIADRSHEIGLPQLESCNQQNRCYHLHWVSFNEICSCSGQCLHRHILSISFCVFSRPTRPVGENTC